MNSRSTMTLTHAHIKSTCMTHLRKLSAFSIARTASCTTNTASACPRCSEGLVVREMLLPFCASLTRARCSWARRQSTASLIAQF